MDGLSLDTQATLLLTARLGGSEIKPLSRSEYNGLAKQLHELELRPGDLLDRVPEALLSVDKDRLETLLQRGAALAFAVERWSQFGIRVTSRSDAAYPQRLKRKLRGAAAPILYGVGDWALLDKDAVCIVGSRDATETGLHFAREVATACASDDLAVISGDARGVDREAMSAALDAGGKVIGMLVEGLSKAALSKRHRQSIVDQRLLLVSPYDPEARFTVANAMDRNKYMYALAIAAVLVDSDEKGGTWAGALENLKHGWTPAFVRTHVDAKPGNSRLAEMGVTPLPHHGFDRHTSIRDLIDTNHTDETLLSNVESLPLFAQQGTGAPEAKTESEESEELFALFLRLLTTGLKRSPKSELAIAREFGLEPIQVRRWLEQARAARVVTQLRDSEQFVLAKERTANRLTR